MTTTDDRDAQRERLLLTLRSLHDSGRPVPCLTARPDAVATFTSDDEADQEFAARLCVGCAARVPCEAYGLAWPKEVGVYGGLTHTERRPKLGRPAKKGDAA